MTKNGSMGTLMVLKKDKIRLNKESFVESSNALGSQRFINESAKPSLVGVDGSVRGSEWNIIDKFIGQSNDNDPP
jgi:hypothetical protein